MERCIQHAWMALVQIQHHPISHMTMRHILSCRPTHSWISGLRTSPGQLTRLASSSTKPKETTDSDSAGRKRVKAVQRSLDQNENKGFSGTESVEDGPAPASPDHVTIYHRPSARTFNVRLLSQEPAVTLFFRQSDSLVNVQFSEKYRTEIKQKQMVVNDEKASGDPSIQSIDELIWKPISLDRRKLVSHYFMLSKIRLTGLVVLTAMAGYAIAPGAFHPATFALCTLGTALTSASANTINQFFEVPYDSQMNRTKNRVLVRGLLSPLHAVGFASMAGASGLAILALGVNPMTAALGATNLGLYTLVYTPMKRLHIANTWIGSIVGAIPPMMGWAACTGHLDPGAFLLGAILYSWQFPHFNALSWNLRQDYSRAGYQMCAVVNPELCKRVAFRHTIVMIGLCSLAPVLDVTTWTFAADSLPLNLYFAYLGWRFYRDGDSKSSRKLFRFSLIHIPALMVLLLISKKHYGDTDRKQVSLSTESMVEGHSSGSPG